RQGRAVRRRRARNDDARDRRANVGGGEPPAPDRVRASTAAPDFAWPTAATAVGGRVLGPAREAPQGVTALQRAPPIAYRRKSGRGGRALDRRKAREVGAADPA